MLAQTIKSQFGDVTHYRLTKTRMVQFFNVDKCETCGGDVLPANYPVQLVRPPGAAGMIWMADIMAADDNGDLEQVIELPSNGYYDDATDMEVCDNCA